MITKCTIWRSHLANPSEIKGIKCCQANTTKIIDSVLKNATLKREFATDISINNWLFDIRTSDDIIFRFTYGGIVYRL